MTTLLAEDPVSTLVLALEARRSTNAAAKAYAGLFEAFVRDAARAMSDRSPLERKAFRDDVAERIAPWVASSGTLAAIRRRESSGSRSFAAVEYALGNRACGDDGVAEAFDRFLLGSSPLAAIRARRLFFKRELSYRLRHVPAGERYRVLVFGSGPRPEVLDVLASDEVDASRAAVTLIDGDSDCLRRSMRFARRHGFEGSIRAIEVDPIRASLVCDAAPLAGQDFVYCPTLFDFVPDDVAARCLEFAFRCLRSGAPLIAAHYHHDLTASDRIVLEWWLEWFPYFRSPREVAALLTQANLDAPFGVAGMMRGPNVYLAVERRVQA